MRLAATPSVMRGAQHRKGIPVAQSMGGRLVGGRLVDTMLAGVSLRSRISGRMRVCTFRGALCDVNGGERFCSDTACIVGSGVHL